MQPRPYQSDVIAAVERGFAEFDRQLVVAPTGSGKTIMFAHLAKRRLPERTLILAHREELIDQAIAKLKAATGIMAEKEKAEYHASNTAHVVVASVQTMIRRLEQWSPNHFGLVVADEAHHAVSDSWQTVLRHFSNAQVVGVTATPDRGDKRNLGEYFQNVAAEIDLFQLINDGYLSKLTLKSIPLSIDISQVRSVAGDLSDAELGNALEPYLPQIALAIRTHASFRRVLCFLPLISTSTKFVAACNAVGLRAEHVDGDSRDRADKLKRFAAWEYDVLSNAMLLTEGYDDPGIDCVCVLRPTRSRALYSQMVGRGTRIDPLKENLLLLDFLWHHERFSITRPAHLIAKTQEEAEQITKLAEQQSKSAGGDGEQGLLDLQGLASTAAAQREATLAKRLAEQKHRKAKYVAAEQFAMEHNALDVAEYEPVMKWERDPVTQPQAKWLKRAGIDPESVSGKGHATRLLNIYFGEQKLRLASVTQRQLMQRMGHPNATSATEAEAKQFFSNLHKHKR